MLCRDLPAKAVLRDGNLIEMVLQKCIRHEVWRVIHISVWW